MSTERKRYLEIPKESSQSESARERREREVETDERR